MRLRIAAFAIWLSVVISNSASAGIYATIDTRPETPWDLNYEAFEKTLDTIKAIAQNDLTKGQNSAMRERYLLIDAMGRDGTLAVKTLEQKLNYSAVLIRRGKAYEATQILLPLSVVHSQNFLVWSQLGTAKFLSGNTELSSDAPECIKEARKFWPTPETKLDTSLQRIVPLTQLEFPDPDFERFLNIEKCLERLMRSRLRAERYAKAKKPPLPEAVDPIFIDEANKEETRPVKFVNEKSQFEPGHIDKAEKAKLPTDAIQIVQQLLIWMPNDDRLMWLLGEVYNASATGVTNQTDRNNLLSSSYKVFNGLYKKAFEVPQPFAAEITKRREALLPFAEIAWKARQNQAQKIEIPGDGDLNKPGEWPLDWWRTVIAGFIAGLAVGMFSIWQLQEIRRRRQARA